MTVTDQASAAPLSSPEWIPFLIEPRFVARVWGSRDLRPWFDCVTPEGDPIGEVWLTGDDCRVATGAHAGKTLADLFSQAPRVLLGAHAPANAAGSGSPSPLLLKVIFAKDKLSVQVHPDDLLAQKYGEPRGKTECWYALDAEPGAQVACGLKAGVTLEKVQQGIREGTLEESLELLPVAAGEMIFVDAGTVHAIWPGSVLLETQQNCDLTYRMYDYGRPRELHIEKSLEATRLTTRAGKVKPEKLVDRTVLVDSEYFRVERIAIFGSRSSASLRAMDKNPPGLAYLFAASGTGRITGADFEPISLPPRSIAAIPAQTPEFTVEDRGELELIRMTPNWPSLV